MVGVNKIRQRLPPLDISNIHHNERYGTFYPPWPVFKRMKEKDKTVYRSSKIKYKRLMPVYEPSESEMPSEACSVKINVSRNSASLSCEGASCPLIPKLEKKSKDKQRTVKSSENEFQRGRTTFEKFQQEVLSSYSCVIL